MEKKLNGFILTAILKNKLRYINYITPLHIKCNCVTDTGWKWRFGSFIRNYNISKYQEKENYAVIIHSHFSELNDNWNFKLCHGR